MSNMEVARSGILEDSQARGLMGENEIAFVAGFFAVLGNPTRLRIAELLIGSECTVNEIAQTLGIQQPNASLNLAALNRVGIVKVAPKGTQRYYSLRGPRIIRVIELAREFWNLHADTILNESALEKTDSGQVDGYPLENADDAETRSP